MEICCVSDLHGYYPDVGYGDLLIISGDLTARDTPFEYGQFAAWMDRQKYKKKILIAGNHDNFFEKRGFEDIKDSYSTLDIDYLCDSGTEFEGLKIWGSPWTPWFHGVNPKCKAFMISESKLKAKWALIPDDTNILITHSPAYGMKDGKSANQRLGSTSLLHRQVRQPLFDNCKLHVCGHIHEGYGVFDIRGLQTNLGDKEACVYVNASHVNEHYQPVNKPVRIIL